MTIIFDEVNESKRARYKVKGCEKVIMVRGDGQFNLNIETVSQCDPRFRTNQVFTAAGNVDICIEQFPCIACGMDLIFNLDVTTGTPMPNVFVEILDDTCVPKPCAVTPCHC